MRKLIVKTAVIFSLLGTMLLLSAPALTIPSVRATGLSMQYGYLDPNNFDYDEYLQQEETCDQIYDYYDWWAYYTPPCNCYWEYTNATIVSYLLDLQSTGEYADWVTNWWVGDFHPSAGYPYPGPYGHMWFYGYGGGYMDISDNLVYTQTTNGGTQSSYETFNFIWTCSNGGRYWTGPGAWNVVNGITHSNIANTSAEPTFTPVNTNTMYGFIDDDPPYAEVGMPFAWAGRTDLSQDGYSSPDSTDYCYIGFEAPSLTMLSDLPDSPYSRQAWEFAEKFYYYATLYGYSVADSLDMASQYCYGYNFGSTPLYSGYWNIAFGKWWFSRMRVLGNSNLYPA